MKPTLLFVLLAGDSGTTILDKLDPLVKLANVGAAGIAVLAVFIIGAKIFNLPNNTSPSRVALLKRFMSMCIILTIICGVCGIASAFFNRTRVQEANSKTAEITRQYDVQVKQMEVYKTQITDELNRMGQILQNSPQAHPEAIRQLNNTKTLVKSLVFEPADQLSKNPAKIRTK